uniref:Uncharacterized protein n=1 Tax=Anguilla anguilla TaxID=7936 RepID=A0A0E9W7A2_ANGAN
MIQNNEKSRISQINVLQFQVYHKSASPSNWLPSCACAK